MIQTMLGLPNMLYSFVACVRSAHTTHNIMTAFSHAGQQLNKKDFLNAVFYKRTEDKAKLLL